MRNIATYVPPVLISKEIDDELLSPLPFVVLASGHISKSPFPEDPTRGTTLHDFGNGGNYPR